MNIVIRDEVPGDESSIRAVVTAAFGQPDEADLVDRLREDNDCVISLVAGEADALGGHVLLSRMTAPFRALGLAPVSVTPDRQCAGIGSRLIRAALERAARDHWQAVFVLGDPAYYGRFGFDAALASGFESPYAGPYLMAKPLGAALAVTAGRIDYAPAFAALDGH
jgi:putative acetyltransferase